MTWATKTTQARPISTTYAPSSARRTSLSVLLQDLGGAVADGEAGGVVAGAAAEFQQPLAAQARGVAARRAGSPLHPGQAGPTSTRAKGKKKGDRRKPDQ